MTIALLLGYKYLRRPKVYWSIFILSECLAAFGLFNLKRTSIEMARGSAATWMFLPILFLIYFGIFRKVYIKMYDKEPLTTSQFSDGEWDQGEYRKHQFQDWIFTAICMGLPFYTLMVFYP